MTKTRTAYILLFTGIFSLCIFSFLFYQRIATLMYSYKMVNQTTQASLQFDRFFLSLRDATVYYRDYLRVYDKSLSDSFNVKIKEYPVILHNLYQLESAYPDQQKKIQHISALADNYTAYLKQLMLTDKTNAPTEAMFTKARNMLNDIRAEITKVTNDESKILKQRDDELKRHIITTPLFLLIFSLISIAITIYAFLQIIKQIKRTKILELSEARLRESEERFRQMADLIPQIVWTAKTNGHFDYYNKRWYEYTGIQENSADQSWIPILHPDDIDSCTNSWYHSVKTGEPYQIEYRFKDKNNPGEYRWFLGKALPIKDKDGEIIKWFGTCTDIHDQKTANEKLEQLVIERASELTEKNRNLNEAQRLAHIGNWDWQINSNKIIWSDELYRIYGIKPDSFKNTYENYISLIVEEDRAHTKQILDEALIIRKPFDFYHRIQTPTGDIKILHQRGKVYTGIDNETIHITGTAQDITETIAIQNQITELNQTFNFAEQTSLIGSFRYNVSTQTFIYSDNLYRILGCKPGEFEPTFENFAKFVHPEDVNNVVLNDDAITHENIANEYLFRIVKKDNSVIHVRSTGIFVTEENERIYIGTLQDITLQHKKEVQLTDQNIELEKMNKELASFSYVASHDLQEPLRKIKMFTKRLLEREFETLSEDSKEYFSRIENAAARMQQLIEDLLSYSRTNEIKAHFELTNIDKLLQEVMENLKEKIAQSHIRVESSGLLEAKVIPFQFQQLFTNLITNSIKFTSNNPAPAIHFSHAFINGELIQDIHPSKKITYHYYKIKDNGIGFDQKYHEQIFGLFQRLNGRNEFEGTGIGLAICKKIVENHNGFISAFGEVGKGATFDIYIPVEQQTS